MVRDYHRIEKANHKRELNAQPVERLLIGRLGEVNCRIRYTHEIG